MQNKIHISIFLDQRRKKSNGKFPVKLRVFNPNPRGQKLYATEYDYTEKEFESIWNTSKPRLEHKQARLELQAIETKAESVVKDLGHFSFPQFEKKLYRAEGVGADAYYHYKLIIEKLTKNERIGNASNFSSSLKSIKGFVKHKTKKETTSLPFSSITPDWLEEYQKFMIDPPKGKEENLKEHSLTTVSMYLRALRTVFNTAITESDVDRETYPFGKGKYQVPSVKKVKKALNGADLRKLFEAKTLTAEQEKARDFWFFSFICNGMNIKDVAKLRYNNIQNDTLVFYRAKTMVTAKTDLKPVIVYLDRFAKMVIAKYGNVKNKPKDLVFPIISDDNSAEVNYHKVKNFTKFINQNIKKLAVQNKVTGDISTYWARHSFATSMIRKGGSMEMVGEALSHSDTKVTQGYFAGFEDEVVRELTGKLMDF
jgi:integrase/recombinase XerD